MNYLKKKRTQIVYLCGVLLFCLILLPTALQANENHMESSILQSASELDYPPFSIVLEDGTAGGFSVELLRAVVQAVGFQVNIKVGPWHEIKQQLATGQLDILPLVSYSAERDLVYDFTVPYLQMHGAVFVRKDENAIHSEADLKERSVYVMQGDTAHEYALENQLSDNLILVESFEEAFALLSSGKGDAVLCQDLVGLQLIKKLGVDNLKSISKKTEQDLKFRTASTTGFEQKFCIAVTEGNKELQAHLNEGLAIIIANGTYDALYQKWFAPILPSPAVPLRTIVKSVLLVLLPVLLLFLLVGVWYLKRKVLQQTNFLQAEILERKTVEEKLRLNEKKYRHMFLDNMAIKLLIDAVSGDIVEVNGAACDFYQYSEEELLNLKITDLNILPREEIFAEMALAKSQGRPHCNFNHRLSTGEIKDVEVYAGTMTQEDGRSLIFSIIHDVSVRKKLEHRLLQAQKMEAIGTLAGGIAHDFNNILGVIIGYADMATEDAPSDSLLAKDLSEILVASHRAKDLVTQILAFSRQAEVERVPLKICPLIKEGLKMLRSSIPSTISITENIDGNCGVVLADPTHVYQILMNLCTNAYQALESHGGELSVTVKTTLMEEGGLGGVLPVDPGEYIEVIVADTGTGIDSDILGKIFDPYFTTKDVGKGTGMGLAIIHGIMLEYGGAITVESKIGKGTSFHVYFPVVDEQALTADNPSEEIPEGTERILFIDDEELLLEMGTLMLERLGYHVTAHHDSLAALEVFQQSPFQFDLVITDQTMPGMTGTDLARRMMQIRPDIPIILCTGYSNLIDASSAKKFGIKDFVLKPITRKLIATAIRDVLAKKA